MEWVPDYTVRFAVWWSLLALVGLLWAYLAITRFLGARTLGRVIVANFTLAFLGVGGDRAVSWLRGLTPNEPPRSFEFFLVWLSLSGVLLMWADLTGRIQVVVPSPPGSGWDTGSQGALPTPSPLREKDHKP